MRSKRDLTPEEIGQIRQDVNRMIHKEVAAKYNVKLSTVRSIAHQQNKERPLSWWMYHERSNGETG